MKKTALKIVAKRRRGSTLVEAVVMMSVLLALSISSVRLLSSVTEIGTRTLDGKRGRLSIQRLANSVREDIHQAKEVVVDDWPLRVSMDDETIRYDYAPDHHWITRTVWRDGDQEQSPSGRDRWTLPRKCEPVLEEQDGFVRIVLHRGRTEAWVIEVAKP